MAKRGAYKAQIEKSTVDAMLEVGEVESLRDEMVEWRENMENSSMEHLPKYEEVEAAASALEDWVDAHETNLDNLRDLLKAGGAYESVLTVEVTYTIMVNRNKRRGPSRSTRLSNYIAGLEATFDVIRCQVGLDEDDNLNERQQEISDLLDEIDVSGLEGIDFPGMF